MATQTQDHTKGVSSTTNGTDSVALREESRLEREFGEEFGTRLSINPNLPANTDFSGGQNMETPNSFKCGLTPTTPFGIGAMQFPSFNTFSLNFQQLTQNQANSQNSSPQDSTADELLSFMPKTPMIGGQMLKVGGFPYGYNFLSALNNSQVQNQANQAANLKNAHNQAKLQAAQNGKHNLNSTAMNVANQVPMMSGMKVESMETDKSPVQGLNLSQHPAPELDRTASEETSVSTLPKKSKRGKAKPRTKRNRNGGCSLKDESRWKSWSREEEVFLVGAVMDRFFKRGSLSSTRADDLSSDDSWTVIKNYYENAWQNYQKRTGIAIPTERPANALSRHYKVMKARISQADMSGEVSEDFRTFFEEWEREYNVDGCLVADGRARRPEASQNGELVKDFRKRKVRLSVRRDSGGMALGMAIRKEEAVTEEYV